MSQGRGARALTYSFAVLYQACPDVASFIVRTTRKNSLINLHSFAKYASIYRAAAKQPARKPALITSTKSGGYKSRGEKWNFPSSQRNARRYFSYTYCIKNVSNIYTFIRIIRIFNLFCERTNSSTPRRVLDKRKEKQMWKLTEP